MTAIVLMVLFACLSVALLSFQDAYRYRRDFGAVCALWRDPDVVIGCVFVLAAIGGAYLYFGG